VTNKITVLIPSYNDQYFLEQLIDSIFQCIAGAFFQVVIVDDHSTDRTPDWIIENLKGRVSYIRPPEKSYFTRAVNHGLNYALQELKQDFILVCNSDITFTDYWAAGMIGTSLKHDAAIVGATLLNPDGTIQHVGAYGRGFHIDINKPLMRFLDGYDPAWVTGAAMMIRVDLLLHMGLFPILVGDPVQYDASDREFCTRAIKSGYNIAVSPTILYHHTLQAEEYRKQLGQYEVVQMQRLDR
jgi:GT2 family glycosyltransferase